MKKLLIAMVALMMISVFSASAATLTLFQEDYETGYDGWTVFGSSNDVGTDDDSSLRRSCPGDFSACGGDNKNDYFWAEDDAGIQRSIDASECDSNVQVTFWTRTYSVTNDEATFSYNLGNGWIAPVEHIGNTWTQYTETLVGSAGNNDVEIAFWLNNGEGDYGLFDDVQVTCETRENGQNDVPEFGTLAAAGILGIAGYFAYKKRKN